MEKLFKEDAIKEYSWWEILKAKMFGSSFIHGSIDEDLYTEIEGYKYKGKIYITKMNTNKMPTNRAGFGAFLHHKAEQIMSSDHSERGYYF